MGFWFQQRMISEWQACIGQVLTVDGANADICQSQEYVAIVLQL